MSKKRPHLDQSEVVEELPLACADESAARAFLERKRWGDHPYCPHCGDIDVYRMTGESAQRRGLWRCRGCSKQYGVRTGTIFEESLIPLHKWCRAFWEAGTCKNGVSAPELSRKLQITYKSALVHGASDSLRDGTGQVWTQGNRIIAERKPNISDRSLDHVLNSLDFVEFPKSDGGPSDHPRAIMRLPWVWTEVVGNVRGRRNLRRRIATLPAACQWKGQEGTQPVEAKVARVRGCTARR